MSFLFFLLGQAAEAQPQVQSVSGGEYAWVIGGIVTILSALTAAVVSIINAVRGSSRNQAKLESDKVIAAKTEEVAEKVDINLGDLKKQIEAINRHVKQQELLLMVLLRKAGLADLEEPHPVQLPPEELDTVIISGVKYKITRVDGLRDNGS